jgi:hypothetical protein
LGCTSAILLLLLGAGTTTVLMQSNSCVPSSVYPASTGVTASGAIGTFQFFLPVSQYGYGNTCSIYAFASQNWISALLGSLTANGGAVTYTVAANTTSYSRTGTILVGPNSGQGAVFQISQNAAQVTAPTSNPAVLSVSPAALTFGTTLIGSATVLNLTLTSPRYASTSVQVSVLPTDPAFIVGSLSSNGLTIPPGGSVVVPVTFRPSAAGTLSSSVTFQASIPFVVVGGIGLRADATNSAPAAGTPLGTLTVGVSGTGSGVPAHIQLLTSMLPIANPAAGFVARLYSTGGTLPYTYTLLSPLPTGLQLDSKTGQIFGTASASTGTKTFSVKVIDASGNTSIQQYSLTIQGAVFPISLIPPNLPPGITGTSYIPAVLNASGRTGPFTYQVLQGNTPDGLSLSSDGTVMGTPTDTGQFHSTVLITAPDGSMGQAGLDMTILNPCVTRIVDGGAYKTTMTFLNLGTQQASFPLVFRDTSGQPLTLPIIQADGSILQLSTVPVSIAAAGATTIETAGRSQDSVQQGWGELQLGPMDRVSGNAVFRQSVPGREDYEAAIPVSPRVFPRVLSPFDNTTPFTTSLAATNPSTTDMMLTFGVRSNTGSQLGTYMVPLPAQNHTAFVMPNQFPLSAATSGVLEINSSCANLPICLGIPMVALRFAEAAFTSYPPEFPGELALPVPGNNVVTIPRIVDGAGTYKTTVTLVNLADPNQGGMTANVTALFWNVDGTPLPLLLTGSNSPKTQIQLQIPIHGTAGFQTNGTNLSIGWVELLMGPNDMVGGAAIFRQTVPGRSDQEAAVPVVTRLASTQLIPFDNTNNFATSLALTNPSGAPITITLSVRGENGAPLTGDTQIPLAGMNHVAYVTGQSFPVTQGKRGVLQFSSASGFSMIGLRYNPTGPFTSYTPAISN